MKHDFVVPVIPAILDFKEHLLCHPRTILSAKYGDGKSYFLNAFKNDKEVKKKFKFITVYPVNYQVLENKDIFDVIKYDILLQMGLNDMLDESIDVSSRDAFLYCIKTNGLDLLGNLFDVAGSIEGAPIVKAIGKIGKALTKVVQKVNDAIKDYQKYKKGDIGVLDNYVEKNDKIAIYEEDLITQIIQKGIVAWRKRNRNGKKRVVLLLEDMDRIDPDHLFRIMNIFSAHMDFSYRYGVRPDSSLRGNKFGVDNVVMVIHYENLESIFHHFYGEETCFEGYINKFADKGKFVYSLKSEAIKYYYNCLNSISNFSEETLKQLLPEAIIQTKSMRELSNSLDNIQQQYKRLDDIIVDITVLMACMRRLGLSDSTIVGYFKHMVSNDIKTWLKYLYPYLKYFNEIDGSVVYVNDDGHKYCYDLEENNGSVRVSASSYYGNAPMLNMISFLYEVLSLVIK